MALVKCKECGGQVSTGAKACPSCGAKPPKKTSFLTWAFLVFIALAIFGSLTSKRESVAAAPERTVEKEKSAAEAKERDGEAKERDREAYLIERSKEAVLKKLKDPDSAQFKDLYFYRAKEGIPVACGQVNSKNSFGGYGGFQGFVSAGNPDLTYLEEQVKDFVKVWNRLCAGERGKK